MRMPTKEEIFSWLAQYHQAIYGLILSFILAYMRVARAGGSLRERLLEGGMCGALTLAAVSGLSFFGLSVSLAAFVGGFLGLIGVDKARAAADRFLSSKADGGGSGGGAG